MLSEDIKDVIGSALRSYKAQAMCIAGELRKQEMDKTIEALKVLESDDLGDLSKLYVYVITHNKFHSTISTSTQTYIAIGSVPPERLNRKVIMAKLGIILRDHESLNVGGSKLSELTGF